MGINDFMTIKTCCHTIGQPVIYMSLLYPGHLVWEYLAVVTNVTWIRGGRVSGWWDPYEKSRPKMSYYGPCTYGVYIFTPDCFETECLQFTGWYLLFLSGTDYHLSTALVLQNGKHGLMMSHAPIGRMPSFFAWWINKSSWFVPGNFTQATSFPRILCTHRIL